jgi:hypothetical protein
MTEDELTYQYPGTAEYTELCFYCLGLSEEGEETFDDSEESHDEE